MYILGISFGFHDSSVTLLKDGEVIYAISEERFSRIKQDNSFPFRSLKFILSSEGIDIIEIDKVVYYENNLLKLNRIIDFSIQTNNTEYFNRIIDSWVDKDNFNIECKIAQFLGIDEDKIVSTSHHLSHAASAFYPSGFKEAAILTIDGVGEYETVTISEGKGNTIEKIDSLELPNSLGLFYSAFTSFLGFAVNEGEYKVMGMAAYGKAIYKEKILQTIDIDYKNNSFSINEKYYNFKTTGARLYTEKFSKLFGKERKEEAPFFTPEFIELSPDNLTKEEKVKLSNENLEYANIAASLQEITEDIMILLVEKTIKLTKMKNLCMAGGVALNSVINGKIRKKFNLNLFIQPASGDSGSSMGAALYYYHNICQNERKFIQNSSLLGEKLHLDSIQNDIKENLFEENIVEVSTFDEYIDIVSNKLLMNNVIGWVSGRFEWGPRALGARSIIADPRQEEMKLIVNEKIKFREPFRPFAPSVLFEEVHKWFDIEENLPSNAPENFMLTVCDVKEDKKKLIPAIVHTDGTARVQIVRKEINPEYYKLIEVFFKKTGIPMILNTSFNLKGEPVVRTVKDAIRTFSYSEMDYLVVYPYIIKSFWDGDNNG